MKDSDNLDVDGAWDNWGRCDLTCYCGGTGRRSGYRRNCDGPLADDTGAGYDNVGMMADDSPAWGPVNSEGPDADL